MLALFYHFTKELAVNVSKLGMVCYAAGSGSLCAQYYL